MCAKKVRLVFHAVALSIHERQREFFIGQVHQVHVRDYAFGCIHGSVCCHTDRDVFKLYQDCSHLVVYGETVESLQRHNEWLQQNAAIAVNDDVRPRLLATAQERHERLRSLTISEALMLYPFLASEASLLLEFSIVFKKNAGECFAQGCEQLCDIVLKHADDSEVAAFSHVAAENPILATLEFLASRCKESLSVILSATKVPVAPCLLKEANGQLSLYIDRERILQATSLLGGLACLFASFWVFIKCAPRRGRLHSAISTVVQQPFQSESGGQVCQKASIQWTFL
ncbi:uncharacterized protein [Dermacentor albipictus]|uniref:uncharacterized protein n=1 Tax=Dermacentor albipictus TaxID=60249 RepID=UPI0038FD2437